MVFGCRYQYSRRLWSGEKPRRHRSIPPLCFLRWARLFVFHKLNVPWDHGYREVQKPRNSVTSIINVDHVLLLRFISQRP